MNTTHHDATYLKDLQRCPEYTRLRHHKGLVKPSTDLGAIDIGIAIHKGLAEWYRTFDQAAALHATEVALARWTVLEKLADDMAFPQRVWVRDIVKAYTKPVYDDTFGVISIEEYLKAELAPGLNWHGIVDLTVETDSGVFVIDHKTTSGYLSANWFSSHFASWQMIGYAAMRRALGLQCDGFMINGIQVPSAKRKKMDFQRSSWVRIADWRIDDFIETAQAELNARPQDEDVAWPRREQGCYAYFKPCQYLQVCTRRPELRDTVLEEDYIEDHWNPEEVANAER